MNKKISVLFAAFFLSPIVFIPAADARPNLAAKFYLEEGKKEFKAKEYDLAIKEFNKALLADPDNEEALMYLKMLGFGGEGSQTREQEPAAPVSKVNKKSVASTEKKAVESAANKTEQAASGEKVKKSAAKADVAGSAGESVKENVAAVKPSAVAEESGETEKTNINEDDQALQDIEDQIAKEEADALKALHEQAAKDQEVLLNKLQQESGKKVSSSSEAKTKSGSKPKSVESAGIDDAKGGSAKEKQKPSASASLSAKNQPKKVDVDAALDEMEQSGAVQPQQDISVQERADKVTAGIKKDTAKKIADYKAKIEDQTAKRIEKVHQKFAAKPIGEKEKTVFRDVDNDGVPEAISLNENKAIQKIEAQAQKEEESGIKKIQKQGLLDEMAALKDLRALIKKEQQHRPEEKVKAGDVVGSVSAGPVVGEGDADSAVDLSVAEDLSGSKDDQKTAALADFRADLARKEKDIEMKYAKKKAIRMGEAEKKLKPQVQEQKVSLAEPVEAASTEAPEGKADFPSDQKITVPNPKSVQAQNVVLKKKFAQVVEMSQKDQDLIKDLEKNLAQRDQKVEVLESDLHETKTSLDSKVELIKQKEEKLKELSGRIAAMETDVNSKQYDFKDKQMEYEKKLQAIQEEFGNYKTERSNSEEELRNQLKTLKEALEKKIAELNAAQEKLIFTENKLKNSEEKYAETTKQYDDVKKTLSDLENRLAGLMATEPAAKTDQAPVVTIDPKNLPPPQNQNEVVYQQWIQRQDQLVTKLKNKLLWAREQMEFLGRYDIKLSDQKMAALKEQLVAVKKQLSAKAPSGRTEEDFAVMDARLKDSQERLEMVEKILREKDDQVKELEKQLNQVLSSF